MGLVRYDERMVQVRTVRVVAPVDPEAVGETTTEVQLGHQEPVYVPRQTHGRLTCVNKVNVTRKLLSLREYLCLSKRTRERLVAPLSAGRSNGSSERSDAPVEYLLLLPWFSVKSDRVTGLPGYQVIV